MGYGKKWYDNKGWREKYKRSRKIVQGVQRITFSETVK